MLRGAYCARLVAAAATRLNRPVAVEAAPSSDRPDVFLSYAREDADFAEGQLSRALQGRGKDVWIDVEDIRDGASDWRANVWAGIEAATAMVFVLSPDSLASTVCGEELARADELNKRIIPVLHRPVDGLPVPAALERPNWIFARDGDDFEVSATTLVAAIELDEPWVERHARLAQRTGEWLRNDRDRSFLLHGNDLRSAERWLDDRDAHHEAPTADQISYITAGRRAAARRQRALLAATAMVLAVTVVLAVAALVQRSRAIDQRSRANDRAQVARAQARAGQSIASLSRDPEESLRLALAALDVRSDEPEARYALQAAVSSAGWTRLLRIPGSGRAGLTDAEFSGDGRRVATAGANGRTVVWDVATGRRLAEVAQGGRVNTVQLSPDGRRLLTAGDDGTARLWDAGTGRALHVLRTRRSDGPTWAATFGAGGTRILTVSQSAGQVWDAASGALLHTLPNFGGFQGTIQMSLDGRRVVTSGKAPGSVKVWDVASGRNIATLRDRAARRDGATLVFALLSADGRRVMTLNATRSTLVVWQGRRRIARFTFPTTQGQLFDFDFSRDGRRVLAAGDGGVIVYSVRPRKLLARMRTGSPVTSAQFDRSGTDVVTASDDGTAQVWRVRPVRRLAVLRGHTASVKRARFSPDGASVITASDDGSARLWPARPRMPSDVRWQHAVGTAFAPHGRAVLVVQNDRRAIWTVGTGRLVVLEGRTAPVIDDQPSWPCGRPAGCAPWSPDGRLVAGVDAAGRAVVWDARTGHVALRFGRRGGAVVAVAFSPDGKRLVVVDGSRRRAQIYQVASGAPVGSVPPAAAASDDLVSAQFVASPLRVLTVDVADVVRLTDIADGATVRLAATGSPPAVAVSSTGALEAVGKLGGRVSLFAGGPTAVRSHQSTDSPLDTLAFNRAGTALVTGADDGTATVWDVRSLRPVRLLAPGGRVSAASFSRRGDLLLVNSEATARLWDLGLQRTVLQLPSTPGMQAELSPDDRELVVAGASRLEARRCDACAPMAELRRRARSKLPAAN